MSLRSVIESCSAANSFDKMDGGTIMSVLSQLQPQSVFHYFEEICRIPHGSGNIRQISDYLKQFADSRGLECIQDEFLNIIIIKEATAGYEEEEAIILQGHMDMVAIKKPDCAVDMTKEPLQLYIEDNKIRANGTSLGGDDGIAVAYALALLDAQDISHPRLEIVLTVDEETGMEGAKEIDLSMLRGKRLINLDQEEEGVIITSCAGGARVDVSVPMCTEQVDRKSVQAVRIQVSGLMGGHSGMEIHKGRGNANCLLGRILKGSSERFGIRLITMYGGQADNAIPREAAALTLVDITQTNELISYVKETENSLRQELGDRDAGFTVVCEVSDEQTVSDGCSTGHECHGNSIKCLDKASTDRALDCLCKLPNGVIAMSPDLEGLVQTSLNLGVIAHKEDALCYSYAVRSSVDGDRERLCEQMTEVAARSGAKAQVRNAYPGWAYRKDSPLRETVTQIYEQMYGKKPVLQAIHAGLECGILASKIEGLDCVSIGPDMADVHTAEESLDIASVRRTWEYLLHILAYRLDSV